MERVTFDELFDRAVQRLNDDSDLFNDMCEELDSYNGFLDDARWYPMEQFDELMDGCTPSEIAEKVWQEDFNPRHNYFKFTLYGVESSDYRDYDDYVDAEDVVDGLQTHYAHLWFNDDSFKALIEALSEGHDEYDIDEENDEYHEAEDDEEEEE